MEPKEIVYDTLERMLIDETAEPTNLRLSLLESITNNFSDDLQIGAGGFAVVYKGLLQNGTIAVKKLTQTFDVHETKFHQEVDSLMRVRHKNVVRFMGYCSDTQGKVWKFQGKNVMAEERQRILCFEFLPKGSLDKYISDAARGLEWMTRYKIIKGICEGLHYLHQQNIVHVDLKPANILLDQYMVPKIADFGLSKCFDEKQTRAMTANVIGSQGYMAPESYGGLITFKTDIYSLGIIIIEILTGKKGYPQIENVLGSWSTRFGTSLEDTRLEPVRECTGIGIECTEFNPDKRPDTRRIIEKLAEMEHKYGFMKTDVFTSSATNAAHLQMEKPTKRKPGFALKITKVNFGCCGAQPEQELQDASVPRPARSPGGGRKPVLRPPQDLSRIPEDTHLHLFTLEELKAATKNFATSKFLGIGGFGPVYQGFVDSMLRPGLESQHVAVKYLDSDSVQGHREWLAEVVYLGMLSHPHLVKLVGFCIQDDHRMLVYEYMPRGSLENHLFKNLHACLPWSTRLKIAVGAAKGLAFLHEAETPVIHRDFTSSNILLDSDYTAKLSDFGLAKEGPQGDATHLTTRVMGTYGYAAPEYVATGHLSAKSDVYGFGVVLLELLSGRRSLDKRRPVREQSLVDWARPYLRLANKLHLHRVMDPSLKLQYSARAAEKAAQVVNQCLKSEPEARPTMRDVVAALEPLLALDDDVPLGLFQVSVANADDTKEPDAGAQQGKSVGTSNRSSWKNWRIWI